MLAATEISFDWSAIPALAIVGVVGFLIFCTIFLPIFVYEIRRDMRRTRIAMERLVQIMQSRSR